MSSQECLESVGYPELASTGAIVIGCIYAINAILTIFWIKKQQKNALLGIEGSAKYVIFPVYVPFMIFSAISDLIAAALLILIKVKHNNYSWYSEYSWATSFPLALAVATQHFVLEGIAFILMQYGCGYQAARRSMNWAFGWFVITFVSQIISFKFGETKWSYISETTWQGILFIFYLCLWKLPEKSFFRRPAILLYSQFWCIFRFLMLISSILIEFTDNDYAIVVSECTYSIGAVLIFALCKPYVLYLTLLSDSLWWQAISKRTSYNEQQTSCMSNIINKKTKQYSADYSTICDSIIEIPEDGDNLQKPLEGIEVGFMEAQELAQAVDNLASNSVKLLNFAYISLDKTAIMLGTGSYSKVYLGSYKNRAVAIKMLFTPDLNVDVIRRCCNEAKILSRISHPNIVNIIGVVVLPPSVCIVLEICIYGSLSDVIRGFQAPGVNKLPLNLTKIDRLFLALECARGVDALHSYSSSLCHKDIKSFNFLVNHQLNVKIADLESGGTENKFIDQVGMTISWQSPEVLKGQEYHQSSDIYSLCLVLWEIIVQPYKLSSSNPPIGTPFADFANKQSEIKALILGGVRPILPQLIDPNYSDIITRGWNALPILRPSINEILTVLTKCYYQSVYEHIYETPHIVNINKIHEAYNELNLKNSNSIASNQDQEILQQQMLQHNKILTNGKILSSLNIMRLESGWEKLAEEGAFVIITFDKPYFILWATKKFTLLTGYLVNDVLASSFENLLSIKTDMGVFNNFFDNIDRVNHCMLNLVIRDGTSLTFSLHSFPVYNSNNNENNAGLKINKVELKSESNQSRTGNRSRSRSSSMHDIQSNSCSSNQIAYIAIHFSVLSSSSR